MQKCQSKSQRQLRHQLTLIDVKSDEESYFSMNRDFNFNNEWTEWRRWRVDVKSRKLFFYFKNLFPAIVTKNQTNILKNNLKQYFFDATLSLTKIYCRQCQWLNISHSRRYGCLLVWPATMSECSRNSCFV